MQQNDKQNMDNSTYNNKSKECIDVIDTLHDMAHKGCFDNLQESVLKNAVDVLRSFLNVGITTK